MTGFHQVTIGGYPAGGLTQDRKPALLANEAFSILENAYVWRERTKKRDGQTGMGRLRRYFNSASLGNSGASPWTFNIYSTLTGHAYFPITPETYAEIAEGTVVINIATLATPFIDQGNGTLTNATPGNSGVINYLTGNVTLITTVGAGHATTINFGYFPSLQVMGIWKQDVPLFGIDNTIYFDTKYAYQYVSGGFQEVVPGTIWTAANQSNGTNTNFFWSCNYQGSNPSLRYFFTTNNNITSGAATPYDPIRYFDGTAWNNLQPAVDASNTLFQALIVIPYYGRLLDLNTWEGADVNTSVNYYARCRFSQIGDPTAATAWRSDEFGKGGFLDAPTNESIVSAAFYRNTLIVFFEYSTWQLRYIGEYGLPFIFERISSDFGAVSTFSSIVFDQGVMAVSDRGIIQAGAAGISRLDEQIPETVFSFQIQNNGPDFVHGVRDFEKEVVYWNYIDTTNLGLYQVFPTTSLLFNYRNNTWAQFRDTISCFGTAQFQLGVTWDSLTTFWDSNVSWDSSDDQVYVDYVVAGNQQGYISIYENNEAEAQVIQITQYSPSLAIFAVTFGPPTTFTVANHNLADGELVYLSGMLWSGSDPGINNFIYLITVIDQNTVSLSLWNGENYTAKNWTSAATYIGGGTLALLPVMNIVGKDFNPFQQQGKQFKLSFIDFQLDSNNFSPSIPAITCQLFVNSYLGEQANIIGNQEILNSFQDTGFVQFVQTGAVAAANPCQVTSKDHSLESGMVIAFANIVGTTQLNTGIYTITVIDANTFSLNGIDATGFTTYISGGIWNSRPQDGQTYIQGTQYAWYRLYSTQFGQYLRIALTYDDLLMNQLSTHQTPVELNAMSLWLREGGRLIN